MNKKIKDWGICPECEKQLEVEEYGINFICPYCAAKINIFPDDQIYFTINGQTIAVGLPENNISVTGAILKRILTILFAVGAEN